MTKTERIATIERVLLVTAAPEVYRLLPRETRDYIVILDAELVVLKADQFGGAL